jgi:GNAT superfamily N-acetyltransferase
VDIEVRPLTPADDLDAFGRIVLDSYRALDGHPADAEYDDELRRVARRVAAATVLGAFAGAAPLGCVTYVEGADNPFAEHLAGDEASFRMLAVAGHAQGRGVGEALVTACIETARDAGRGALFIHSGDWMAAAHRLYGRLGFVRVPERDWHVDGIVLLGFHRAL